MSSRDSATAPSSIVAAAGVTDTGRQRDVNEDRFYVDAMRGIFFVIDGVGGHAAGGKAADVALARVRERLERETGTVADRIREAITIANNEIHRLAATRPEWDGMACVLTAVVLRDDRATVGHVGDTRLYVIRRGQLEKITRDHSPVGEREDAGELGELEAMRHPRRNEVYRDIGSDAHDPADEEFVDIQEVAFERDSALLLCSDGLTDLVDSTTILGIVTRFAGDPQRVAAALVEAANDAGGKDNVTAVYIEGAGFSAPAAAVPQRTTSEHPAKRGHLAAWLTATAVVAGLAAAGAWLWVGGLPALESATIMPLPHVDVQYVNAPASISEALQRAAPGSAIVVGPGEYREQLFLAEGVRLVSRIPGAATIRLPATAPDGAAVVASNLSAAEFVGFRIVGDAATPLGVGVFVDDAAVSIVDVEITGATRAGVEFGGTRSATLLGSRLHGNTGAALVINRAAAPRIAHNTFNPNRAAGQVGAILMVEEGAAPSLQDNVFMGVGAEALASMEKTTRLSLAASNWFIPPAPPARPRPAPTRSGRKP
jgi:PPM family protein phosphatase